MKTDNIKKIFDRVQECMEMLVGGSGHVCSYRLVLDTFKINREEDISDTTTKYHFSVQGYRESEFTVYDEDSQPEPETLEGSITLDMNYDLVRDEQGDVLLEPWKSIVPVSKQPILSSEDRAQQLLCDKLKLSFDTMQLILNEGVIEHDDKIKTLLDDIQLRIDGVKPFLIDRASLQDIYCNGIIGVMNQDMLAPDDTIDLLLRSFQNRLDHFDDYYKRLKRNELHGPYEPGKDSD
jgi:hypothetical protein